MNSFDATEDGMEIGSIAHDFRSISSVEEAALRDRRHSRTVNLNANVEAK
jgi:hypothetical protein